MKLSANTLGILLFTSIATTAFAWMTQRPQVEGSVMLFGMPAQKSKVVEEKEPEKEVPQIIEEETDSAVVEGEKKEENENENENEAVATEEKPSDDSAANTEEETDAAAVEEEPVDAKEVLEDEKTEEKK